MIFFELGRGSQASRLLDHLDAVDAGIVGYRASRAVTALQGQSLQVQAIAADTLERTHTLLSGVSQRCRYAALAAPHLPPPAALKLCTSALELAEGLGLKAHLPALLASQAGAMQRGQRHDDARRAARRSMRLLDSTSPLVYRGIIFLTLHDVLSAVGRRRGSARGSAAGIRVAAWHRTP
jgi:hypothetical protein